MEGIRNIQNEEESFASVAPHKPEPVQHVAVCLNLQENNHYSKEYHVAHEDKCLPCAEIASNDHVNGYFLLLKGNWSRMEVPDDVNYAPDSVGYH